MRRKSRRRERNEKLRDLYEAERRAKMVCAFCDRDIEDPMRELVAGRTPDVYICEQCAELVVEVFADRATEEDMELAYV